jgi:hypothetical protein
MTGIERLWSNEPPTLDEWKSWMNNASFDLAKRYLEDVRKKIESGDERWNDHLDLAIKIVRRRFKNR